MALPSQILSGSQAERCHEYPLFSDLLLILFLINWIRSENPENSGAGDQTTPDASFGPFSVVNFVDKELYMRLNITIRITFKLR